MAKLLVAEDDAALNESLEQLFAADGHTVDFAINGNDADQFLKTYSYELIVLDWDLPGLSGVEICRRFRIRGGVTPILILTGKASVAEKEEGLDAGADDYLTKPFHPRELGARLRALLRRPPQVLGETLKVRDIEFKTSRREVTRAGQVIYLTALEMDLLEFLMRHPGETFSIEALLKGVWHSEAAISDDAIYAVIKRLRRKLDRPGQPTIIANVHGLGYRLEQ